MENANSLLFRSSGVSDIMVNAKTKTVTDTIKGKLIDAFVKYEYGREEELNTKFFEKGNDREEDAITLLSVMKGLLFNKNEKNLKNDYISGTPDVFVGETIETATEILDTKCSWSANTFFKSLKKKTVTDIYKYQGHSYMWLTGAKKHTVAYCLVNGTAKLIDDEKRRMSYSIDAIDYNTSPEYIEKCKKIEINHIFDIEAFVNENPFYQLENDVEQWAFDIPMEKRLHLIEIHRDELEIARIQQSVIAGRGWINKEMYMLK